MRTRSVLAAVTALALVPLAAPVTATAGPPQSCGPISISYVFDNDQTGGWWVVTTSMNCSPSGWYKRYNYRIYDRPFTKYFVDDITGYVTGSYEKRTIVPATASSQKKSACVSAKSELYYLNKELLDSESRNACFNTAAPN